MDCKSLEALEQLPNLDFKPLLAVVQVKAGKQVIKLWDSELAGDKQSVDQRDQQDHYVGEVLSFEGAEADSLDSISFCLVRSSNLL